jgi:hypothetical protein
VSERRRLKFANADEVAAEVGRLRKGYTQAGEWSLAQMCGHLDMAIRYSMQPAPERKNETTFLQWLQLKLILAFGRLPAGIAAPKRITPPDDTPDSAIDEFLVALREMKDFKGEFSPHPRLGKIKRRNYVRLHLIHCAHHLGFLSPAGK